MEGYRNIPFTLSYIPFSSHILHGKLVSSGPGLTGSTHYLLCSWVPHGGFSQPQDYVVCLQSWVGRISGYGRPNMGLEPPCIFIFTGRPRNRIHRYQEMSLISFLKPTKRDTSRKKVAFQKKKKYFMWFKKKCWDIIGGIVIYLYPIALQGIDFNLSELLPWKKDNRGSHVVDHCGGQGSGCSEVCLQSFGEVLTLLQWWAVAEL